MAVLPHRPPLDQMPQSTMWTEYCVSHVGRAIVHARSVDIAGATGSADHGSWGARMAESRPDRTLQGFGSTTRGGSNQWPAIRAPSRPPCQMAKCSLRTQPGRTKAHPTNPDTAGSGTERRSWHRRRFPVHGFGRPRWLAGGTERTLTKKQHQLLQIRLCEPALSSRVACKAHCPKRVLLQQAPSWVPRRGRSKTMQPTRSAIAGPLITLQSMAADPTPARSFLLHSRPRPAKRMLLAEVTPRVHEYLSTEPRASHNLRPWEERDFAPAGPSSQEL